MKKCKFCGNKGHIVKSPLGYFGECCKNGHVHNIGIFYDAKHFCVTEKEAEKEWDRFN
jgi:hypothetical protein